MEISVPRVAKTALNDAMKATIYTCVVRACKLLFNLLLDQNQSLLSGNKKPFAAVCMHRCVHVYRYTHDAKPPRDTRRAGGLHFLSPIYRYRLTVDERCHHLRRIVHTVIPAAPLGSSGSRFGSVSSNLNVH